jgi:hypothetical protein
MANDLNPFGLRTFDHSDVVRLPEYAKMRRVLDELAHAIERDVNSDDDESDLVVTQADWVAIVDDSVRSTPFADNCETCQDAGDYKPRFPYKVELDDDEGGLTATYQCHVCNRTWTCGWASDAPLWAP